MDYTKLELNTKRLVLRPVKLSYASNIYKILSKYPDLTYYLTFNPPKKLEDTEQFINQALKNMQEKKGMCWAIFFEEKIVGIIGLDDIEFFRLAWKLDLCHLGYWLSPEYHRRGIMYEATQAVIKCCFTDMKLHKIIADHVTENKASEGLIKKLGFHYVGERKKHFFRHNRWWNYKMWELLKENY